MPFKRQIYYAESLARVTHTGNTTAQDKSSGISWEAKASTSYMIVWSAILDCNTAGTVTARLYDTTLSQGYASVGRTNSTGERVPVGGIVIWTNGATPATQAFKVQYATANSGNTVGCQDVTLAVVELTANDSHIYQGGGVGDVTTNSTTYVDVATIAVTPATTGDYLILTTGVVQTPNQTDGAIRATDGSATWGVAESITSVNAAAYMPWFNLKQVTLTGASTTNFAVQHKTANAANQMLTRRCCIVALRLDDGFSRTAYAENRARTTNTTVDMMDKTTLTASLLNTPSTLAFHVQLTDTSASQVHHLQAYWQGAGYSANGQRFSPSASTKLVFWKMYSPTLAARVNDFRNRFASNANGNTTGSADSAIAVLQSGGDQIYLGSKVPDSVRFGDVVPDRMYLGTTKVYGF